MQIIDPLIFSGQFFICLPSPSGLISPRRFSSVRSSLQTHLHSLLCFRTPFYKASVPSSCAAERRFACVPISLIGHHILCMIGLSATPSGTAERFRESSFLCRRIMKSSWSTMVIAPCSMMVPFFFFIIWYGFDCRSLGLLSYPAPPFSLIIF